MKKFTLIIALLILSGTVSANLVGLWNFDGNLDNDLNSRSPLVLYGSQDISFDYDTIAGDSAEICSFPAFANFSEGIGMTNESGLLGCTNYTIILDIKYPALNQYAALFSFGKNPGDGDFFIKKGEGIGISGQYAGTFNEDTWYRVVFSSYYTSDGNLVWSKYIDGSLVATQIILSAYINRMAIDGEVKLFTDDAGETAAGMVNSLAFYDETLNDPTISSIGSASATGIPDIPEPASIILMLTALAGLLIRA